MTAAAQAPPSFQATLYPNPPLGRSGFRLVMIGSGTVCVIVGSGFVAAGAWPVTGFLGLDLLLLYAAFRWVERQSRRLELVRLDHTGLYVRRVAPDGSAADWRLEPYWVRVAVEERRRGPGAVTLRAPGVLVRIGQFLTSEERREFARALEGALRAYRPETAASGD
jgi:uncharacterized membrane protein